MINKINYSPSFQKQLRAKANILNNNKPEQCFIYELNKEEDSDYFKELKKMPEWQEKGFAEEFDKTLKDQRPHEHLFVMESKDEECLGILELDDDILGDKVEKIEYLETFKPYSYHNENRNRKYIGQTLLTFAAKYLGEIPKKDLKVPSAVINAVNFYIDKCNFYRPNKSAPYELLLKKENFNELIKKNEENTQGKMELIG